ncbi:TPA: hypothetical protein N2826_005031 [Vibrio parahaemolyticus]|uniref:hypothetical protein n=1 Tax=Vibrio parahaemolyticus TaxID=670 RepID=UPI00215C16E4|nr:hypothetical protein [Vibrio parahaemolyticus]MCS0014518.1 hypothetical protein [Vibrio parahaemolyticus]HCM0880727.1 hypothetical protein [Vibrio parahaemolyticus]HCM0884484.1 hypothetical protein [Vibrio parahaemolyticus]
MASHMASQVGATKRNTQAELFVDYLLREYFGHVHERGLIRDLTITMQAPYKNDIASDIWDHKVCFHHVGLDKEVEIWCQTTCYKGHGDVKKKEPNKSYEVKETLVEAISLRKLMKQGNKLVRSVHFTVGDVNYTYAWFKSLKEKSFDLSLYLDTENENIFSLLNSAIGSNKIEFKVKKALKNLIHDNSEVSNLIQYSTEFLEHWFVDLGLKPQPSADEQWDLVEKNLKNDNIPKFIENSKNSGFNVKKQASTAIHNGYTDNHILEKTVENLLADKPALKRLVRVKNDWSNYCDNIQTLAATIPDVEQFVSTLWSNKELKEVNRRLLLRSHTKENIDYIQDLDVEGVTEHNLYTGAHKPHQIDHIVSIVVKNFASEGASTSDDIASLLTNSHSKNLVRQCLWFEARNGTSFIPSFKYITLKLQERGYNVKKPKSLTPKLIGYHADLTDETVKPYQNFMGIYDNSNNLLGLLKGKFFSVKEFPRRCKEEAFTGITIQNEFVDGRFAKRHEIPIIMFIDMEEDFEPPEFSLKRLAGFGWTIAFNEDEIIEAISK